MAYERDRQVNIAQVKGAIKKLKFHNFMSCSYLEYDVEPNLNLIVGPNGMGKSTIICGICLALGGNPKLLGRSEKMADYIKQNERSGSVEVHLKKGGDRDEVQIVRLDIHLNNKCDFFVDGERISKCDLMHFVSSYNIQVDNPCVFLAQDKVKSFAEQNPIALLENTEKACSIELQETHAELKNLSQHDVSRGERRERCEKKLKSIENELESLSGRVENFLRKEGMEMKIKSLQQREIFIICEREEQTLEKREMEMNKAKEKVLEITEELNKAERENQSKMEEMKQFQKEYKQNDVMCGNIKSELDKISKQRSIDDMIRQSKRAYGEAKEDYGKWQQEVKKVETTLQEYQSKLADSQDEYDSIEQENASLRKDYEDILKRGDELKREEIKMKSDYEKLLREQQAVGSIDTQQHNQFSHRLQILRNATPGQHAIEAYRWIQEHKEQFRKPVYIPVLTMTMNNSDSAMYLENLISKRDFVMFICGCREDEKLLTNCKHPWRINSTFITDQDAKRMATEGALPERIRQFGFNRTAFQLFSAPLPVKAYLNSVAHLSNIPIGTKETENRLDEVCETLKSSHRLFLTPELKMRIIISAYRRDITTQATDLRRDIRYLNAHKQLSHQRTTDNTNNNESSSTISSSPQSNQKSANSLDERTAKLRNDLQQLKSAQQKVAVKQDAIRTQLSNISTKGQQLKMVKHLIDQTEQKLKQLNNRKPDLEAAKSAVQSVRRHAIKKHLENFKDSIKLIEKLESVIKLRTFARRRYQETSRFVWKDDEEMNDIKEKLHKAKEEFEERQQEVNEVKRRIDEVNRKLFDLCKISSTNENSLDSQQRGVLKDLKDRWTSNSIPSELEHIQEMLADERARLELASSDGTISDVTRQSNLLKDKENYQRTLETISNEISSWRATMDSLLNKWLNPLEKLISRINSRYVHFFRKMGCSGEVLLQRPDDKYDVSHYGVVILVKFHDDESLRALTHKTQSGGERSVATMLYLMVLQELCSVPFCCVDEINQGMDQVNERNIFEILVSQLSSTTSALSRTQYFLLTPKLLDGLQYADVSGLCLIQPTA